MDDIKYERVNTNKNTYAMIHYIDKHSIESNPMAAQMKYIPPHWHRSIEFSLVCKGEANLWINNEKKVIKEGEFIFVNSSQIHHLDSDNPFDVEVLLVIISYDFLKHVLPQIDTLYFDIDKDCSSEKRIHEIYDFFYQYTHVSKEHDELLINAYLYELLYILMRDYQVDISQKNYFVSKKRQHRILEYIESHYNEDLNLTILAQMCHMNEEYFSWHFKKLFGINFKTYLTDYRIYRSFYDVVNSDKSIQNISMEYGFSCIKSFINSFKKRYGLTPYQYRKKYKQTNVSTDIFS